MMVMTMDPFALPERLHQLLATVRCEFGGSVARARPANVSMIKLTQSIRDCSREPGSGGKYYIGVNSLRPLGKLDKYRHTLDTR